MLRHIFGRTFLWATLFLASLPAFAYANCVATQDCCPAGPLTPCGIEVSTAAPSNAIQPCSTANPTASTAFAAEASTNDFHKNPKRSHFSATLPSPAIWMVHLVSSRSSVLSTKPSFNPSFALLYLSTGRLRL